MPKKKRKIHEENTSNFYLLPVAFVITIIPLIVFMKNFNLLPVEVKNWYGEPSYNDFFNYYKSQWLLAGTVTACVFYICYSLIKGFKPKKSFLYIPTALYAILIILSTVLSKNPEIALRGFVARYEGMFALLCYLLLMLIVYNLVNSEKNIKFLLGALLISSVIIGTIGLFQFLELDLFRSNFGKLLILPEAYHKSAETLSFRFEKNAVYATFSNTNYVGSYMVLVIPIAVMFAFYLKNIYLKAGAALLSVILLVSLFGSRSRAGLVGLAVSILIALILFRKAIFKRWIVVSAAAVSLILIFFGMNFVLKGVLVDRILSEFVQDSQNEQQFYDLQDIIFNERSVSVVGSSETLTIRLSEDSRLYFYDTSDELLDYDISDIDGGKMLIFSDDQYRNYVITIKGDVVTIDQKQAQIKFRASEDKFKIIGINGDETDSIHKPETLGFAGKERLGSARGYIWSRTLPMLKNAVLLGYGPDTYAIEFPQNDYIGKIRAYGTAHMIVDKPHDIYLQIAVNTGVLSLLIVVAVWGFYIVQSLRIYAKSMDNSFIKLSGAAVFIAICGFLTAGLFNDSVVGISPIFWVLLGIGFVNNAVIKAQSEKARQLR